ncbi:MAG: tryptophan--tRNA ligase [Acidobacteria bacterium]|nr:MAG: tryptophan--tRNA ligase [Acidobacteriota bacterium]
MRKRIFSGAQPSGNVHLGNYLGALRNWVALQAEYESFFCIVNLHAITVAQDPKVLAEKTRELARIYLAVGIDPEISTVFVQSDVPQHTELTWLLNCVTLMSEFERMTLYQTDLVPVGEDQKQHLELARDIAIRFNRDYGETFRVPEPFIPTVGARIMSLADPAKKMSKSDEESESGCIMLLDDADAVRRKFKRAVTDSGTEIRFDATRPAITNLLTIYHLLTDKSKEETEEHFGGHGYAKLKEELAEVTIEFLRPFQERVRGIDDGKLDQILERGAARAEEIAAATLTKAKVSMGLVGARG